MGNVTLADVAKKAGVSIATASMVLHNRGRISVATRQRVLEAMETLNYVYNQTAANLRLQSGNHVGLLLHDISNPFYAEMTAGVSEEIERYQWMLFLANTQESFERQQKFVDALLKNSSLGMILCPTYQTPDFFYESLKRRHIPVVMAVRPIKEKDFDFVGTDNVLGTQLAMQHLLNLGHKNIAFIGGRAFSSSRAQRVQGFTQKLEQFNLSVNPYWIVECDATQSAGANVGLALLQRYPEITAAVCYQDIVALGMMQALHQLGKKIGKDFALIGFDDITEASSIRPALTTVSVAVKEIGRKAAELLYQRINGDDSPRKQVILPPALVIRQSCGYSLA